MANEQIMLFVLKGKLIILTLVLLSLAAVLLYIASTL